MGSRHMARGVKDDGSTAGSTAGLTTGSTAGLTTGSTAKSGEGVKSARRAVELLEAFGANHAWLSLTDLHQETGFPRSSLHGLLRTLRDVGWIEADEAGTR